MAKNDAHTGGQAENSTVIKTNCFNKHRWKPCRIEFKSSLLSQVSVLVLTYCCSTAGLRYCLYFHFSSPSFSLSPLSSFLSLTCRSAGGHPLCLRCLTMEIWRPRLRWTEQHSSQIRTPRLILVQPGSGRQTERSRWRYYKLYKHSTYTAPLLPDFPAPLPIHCSQLWTCSTKCLMEYVDAYTQEYVQKHKKMSTKIKNCDHSTKRQLIFI